MPEQQPAQSESCRRDEVVDAIGGCAVDSSDLTSSESLGSVAPMNGSAVMSHGSDHIGAAFSSSIDLRPVRIERIYRETTDPQAVVEVTMSVEDDVRVETRTIPTFRGRRTLLNS